jgi:hypothetical protein
MNTSMVSLLSAAAAAAAAAVCRLVFEVLPRRIQLHLPDSRLLLEGQAAAAAAATATAGEPATATVGEAATAGHTRRHKHWWRSHRRKAMRTGTVQPLRTSVCMSLLDGQKTLSWQLGALPLCHMVYGFIRSAFMHGISL